MSIKQVTSEQTEADLEAQIRSAIQLAFPWLPANSIKHQTKFRVQIGRKPIEVDGKVETVEARADILVYSGERCIAVLELKRPGADLSLNDDAQGLSYAKLLTPPPPLVVVTNGTDVHFIETHTGKAWKPEHRSEAALQGLIDSAARVAKADLKEAIETLMGTSPAVWMPAIRRESMSGIEAHTGPWADQMDPFVEGLLFPRDAADQTLDLVAQGKRLTLLVGPPLAGKSNVLRDICEKTAAHESIAALFLEKRSAGGIFQAIADVLSRTLEWHVLPSEARQWLTRVSQSMQHRLLILIDELDPDDREACRELEELCSRTFGPGLALAVAVHDSAADRLCMTANSLGSSAIGRIATRVQVGPLNDQEFRAAADVLGMHRLVFTRGAEASAEMREPWILRAVSALAVEKVKDAGPDCALMLPPFLSLELIGHARERFKDPEVLRMYQAVAAAVLDDAKDGTRENHLQLESLHTFVVRRAALAKRLDAPEIQMLIAKGFLRAAMHANDVPVLYMRLPELVASELAKQLTNELVAIGDHDAEQAANLLNNVASHLPVGDVIAAFALVNALYRLESLSDGILNALVDRRPKRVSFAGKHVAMNLKEIGYLTLKIGQEVGEEPFIGYEDFHPWLVLSHLAMVSIMGDFGGEEPLPVGPELMLLVGKSEVPLRRPGNSLERNGVLVHELPEKGSVVCHGAGFLEQITYAIFDFLASEGENANHWIDRAMRENSVHLLTRVHIALDATSECGNEEVATWAKGVLQSKVTPALKRVLEGICFVDADIPTSK